MRVGALLLAASLISTPAANDRAMELLRDWIGAVDEHTPGEHDSALQRISSWADDQVEMMLDYVQALADLPVNTTERRRRRNHVTADDRPFIGKLTTQLESRGDFDRFLKRAALLHTDLAMFGSARITAAPPPPVAGRVRNQPTRRVDVLSHDGQVQQYQLANPHWQYARDLLDALPKKPSADPILAQWYRAVGAHFMLHRSFAEAMDHFDAAREMVPNEPDVLYGDACLQEVLGAPRIQDYVRVAMRQGVTFRDVASSQSHVKRAVELLRKTLAIKPNFIEARLRLGRLLVEQKNYSEAITHLQTVMRSTTEPRLLYYAWIFSGDAAMGRDNPGGARIAYQHALELYPDAQAASLGLATALRFSGERQPAVEAIMSTLAVAPDARDEADEPWWNYFDGDEIDVNRLLAQLRAPYLEQ